MIGTSYVGGTQHALAMAGSPQLTTVIPGRRDVEPGLRACATRGVRAAVLELDLHERRPGQPRSHAIQAPPRCCKEMSSQRLDVPAQPAHAPRHDAAEARAGVRGLAGRGDGPRRERRVLEAEQHHRPSAKVQGHAGVPGRRLVRLLGQQHDGQLHGPDQSDHGPGLSDHGAVDSRRAGATHTGR